MELIKPKLTIEQNLLFKIYRLCQINNHTEWSGILFYKKVKGSAEKPNEFEFIATDLFLMDIGSEVLTEYEFDNDVVSYLTSHPEYMSEEYAMGAIHSHHSMATFFSGTDLQDLEINAPLHNYYISLIVNNRNSMTAKVAIANDVEKTINTRTKVFKNNKYQWIDNEPKVEVSTNVIDYDLDIELSSISSFESRIKLIQSKVALRPTISNNKAISNKNIQTHLWDTDDTEIEEKDVIKYINSLLGNSTLDNLSNLKRLSRLSDNELKNYLNFIKTNAHFKFVELFNNTYSFDEMVEVARDEILDYEDTPDVEYIVYNLVDTLDEILIKNLTPKI